jgi:hypothetical protein
MRLLPLLLCFAALPAFSQSYFVRFPDDVIALNCNGSNYFGEPLLYNPDNLPLVVEYNDMPVEAPPVSCYWFERIWFIYNPATYSTSLPCTQVPNPNPNALPIHAANLPGPVISSIDTLGNLWSATVSKIALSDPTPTNFSTYWSADANCYQYRQWVKIYDVEAPFLENCQTDSLLIQDTSLNDPHLWNATYWWDPLAGSQDLRESKVDFSIKAFDSCGYVFVRYLLYLDLDQDGHRETNINSLKSQPPGMLSYNNLDPDGSNSSMRMFDQRPGVDSLHRYRFAIESVWNSNPPEFRMRWAEVYPDTVIYSLPQLPPGQHAFRWEAYDNCGNYSSCEYMFEILGGVVKTLDAPHSFLKVGLSPNPFIEKTTIQVELSQANPIKLRIWNAAGQQVFENSVELPASAVEFTVTKTNLGNTPGLYWYSLETGSNRTIGKMVLLP